MSSEGSPARPAARSAARRDVRRRRTQAERSAETRQRLLDATIVCLGELGYTETTTSAVATRAGLSRGAMLHHFGTRAELLRAAADEIMIQSEAILDRSMARPAAQGNVFEHAFDGAVDQLNSHVFQASAELMMAFRTDPGMKDFFTQMYQVALDRSQTRLRAWAAQAGVEEGPKLEAFLDLVAVAVSGIYFHVALPGGAERARTAVDQLQAFARTMTPAPRDEGASG